MEMYHLRQITYNNKEIMKTNLKLLLCLAFSLSFFSLQAKTIYYVKVDGTGDGSSWANAANNIQTMIDKAVSGDEVWVAKGTYYPTTETIARDPRSKTFLLNSGINLYGGFAGNESLISQRTLADLNIDGKIDSCELVNTTILSGDIDGITDVWTKTTNSNGTWKWTITGNSGNCYHVVKGTSSTKINGFSVIGGNANSTVSGNNYGGGISTFTNVTNCIVSNCSADYNGGGIFNSDYVTNCIAFNCSATNSGGGILASVGGAVHCIVSNCTASKGGGISGSGNDCIISNCSVSTEGGGISGSATNCLVYDCSADTGGGVSGFVTNCIIFNCSAINLGGGIYGSATNSTISNCSAANGGGVCGSPKNCTISNCSASSKGGGVYNTATSTQVINCSLSNNSTNGVVGNGIQAVVSGCISPDIIITFLKPSSFIGKATTTAQRTELLTADWHLKEGSPCINTGTTTNILSTILSGNDYDGAPRVSNGTIDIGAYEYIMPKVNIPIKEDLNTITDWNSSGLFYNSSQINGGQNIKWVISNQKADFTWQTNLTSTYSQPIFTYLIDASISAKVFLRYDMFFQAYTGTISPLGTEKLNVEYSTDLVTWSTIATYSNANGTITNQTYKHDLSSQLAGKTFFIRFNANGANSNRIEKWEIDNVIIDADGLSAVKTVQETKYKYSVNKGVLNIANLGQVAYIQLFDINGKMLANKAESQTVNFTLPVHGVYLIKVTSDAGVEYKKIVW